MTDKLAKRRPDIAAWTEVPRYSIWKEYKITIVI